jgi:hypothetical protein
MDRGAAGRGAPRDADGKVFDWNKNPHAVLWFNL